MIDLDDVFDADEAEQTTESDGPKARERDRESRTGEGWLDALLMAWVPPGDDTRSKSGSREK